MYDVYSILKPKGDFNPASWKHVQVNDIKNHVKHLCLAPVCDQFFEINGQEFSFKKGDTPLVVTNCFKMPYELVESCLMQTKLRCICPPERSSDQPMVMLNVA